MAFTVTESNRVVVVSGGTGVVTKNTWAISRVRWVTTTVGTTDSCVIQDNTGAVIWQSLATATASVTFEDETEFSKTPAIVGGIQVTTLTSGTLYIYLR